MVEQLPVAPRQRSGKLSGQALFRKLFVVIQNKQPSFGLTSYPQFTIQARTANDCMRMIAGQVPTIHLRRGHALIDAGDIGRPDFD
jgi:hypothetical protein